MKSIDIFIYDVKYIGTNSMIINKILPVNNLYFSYDIYKIFEKQFEYKISDNLIFNSHHASFKYTCIFVYTMWFNVFKSFSFFFKVQIE